MTKNKKIIIASVGVLCVLVASALFIRSPDRSSVHEIIEPPKVIEATQDNNQQSELPPPRDDSHEKVEKIIDQTTSAVSKQVPGLWARVTDSWDWIKGLDAKHALILSGAALFLCSVLIGSKNKKKS